MKIIRHANRKIKLKKKLQEQPKKFEKRWKTRPRKKVSLYPYIISISQYRRNLFLTVADFRGRIKLWTSMGIGGYKNKEKLDYLAVFPTVIKFLKILKKRKILRFFFIFKNLRRIRGARIAFQKVFFSFVKKTKKNKLLLLGCWTQLHMSFNGCRSKKKRRKRKRRRVKWFNRGWKYRLNLKYKKKTVQKISNKNKKRLKS